MLINFELERENMLIDFCGVNGRNRMAQFENSVLSF
jgi:hypothetical protein